VSFFVWFATSCSNRQLAKTHRISSAKFHLRVDDYYNLFPLVLVQAEAKTKLERRSEEIESCIVRDG
jgi:hypothetical protein